MIGWCPSLRSGVAVRPRTYLAFTCFITCSKVNADKWWHSSTMTCPYSATRSLTPSLPWVLWMMAISKVPLCSPFPPPIWPIDLAGRLRNIANLALPLIQQLLAMNQHEGIHLSQSNQPCGHCGLAESSRGAEDLFVV